jgi:hypothetical protein
MLIRVAKLFAFLLMAGTLIAAAETSDSADPSNGPAAVNPVAQVSQNKSWEYGPFVSYGNGIGIRSDYHFLSAGFQVGKPLTPVLHAGIFTGQFELGGNIMPLWQAYTPAPHTATFTCVDPNTEQPVSCILPVGGGTYRGVSITPAIFRWNFVTRSRRVQPWFQAAGGIIYTTREFPPNYTGTLEYPANGSTCVWNFTPQGGGGLHYFIRPKRSIDLGVNAMHISSASLGDHNPGVNASVQVQLGYTFWK